MFVGHFGVAFAAKRLAPRQSLATLVAASALVDLVWPLLVLAGVEEVRIDPGNTAFTPLDFVYYPWTHSALLAAVWSGLFGAAVLAWTRDRGGALVAGLLVFSHWVLDLVSHRPDLPLWPGGPRVGLGLWNSVPATLVVELALFATGLVLYVRATRALDRIGRWGFWGMATLLLVIYVSSSFGPPPPDARTLAISALTLWIFVPWAWWVDRHRALRGSSNPATSAQAAGSPVAAR